MNPARPFPVALFVLLCSAVVLGACAEDENPVAPGTPDPPAVGTVIVDVSPDGSFFTWSLASGDSTVHTGHGDSLLAEVRAGECGIVWDEIAGYRPAEPAREYRTLAGGDTLTFATTYSPLPPDTVSVLFLGSSYFNWHAVDGLFAGLAASRGKESVIDAHCPSGHYLDYHATSPASDSLIRSREWDYVILQGVGRITAYPEDANFNLHSVLSSLDRKIHRYSPGAKVMYQMPWAFEDGMLWTPGGTDDYFAMQQRIYDNTLALVEDLDVVIAPVGWAWNTVMLEGLPKHYLFEADWNHPSLRGAYLMACVFYSSVFLEPIDGSAFLGGLPEEESHRFQDVASDMVMENLITWKLEGGLK